MSDNKPQEGNSIAKPNVAFRSEPELMAALRKKAKTENTAEAIRKAIFHYLECVEISDFSDIGNNLLTVTQVAEILKKTTRQVRNLCKDQIIPAVKVGDDNSSWLIHRDKLMIKLEHKPKVKRLY